MLTVTSRQLESLVRTLLDIYQGQGYIKVLIPLLKTIGTKSISQTKV